MPQLDSFYFLGESVIALTLLYTFIYFYLFWFSKQKFEFWVVSASLNYYFEKQAIYLVFVNTDVISHLVTNLKNFYDDCSIWDLWKDNLTFYDAIE